jgi:hypothetical protein
MDIKAEKLNVLQQIINTNDLSLIREIKSLLNRREQDWLDDLSKNQKKDVEVGISQLDDGIFLSHEEAKNKFGI